MRRLLLVALSLAGCRQAAPPRERPVVLQFSFIDGSLGTRNCAGNVALFTELSRRDLGQTSAWCVLPVDQSEGFALASITCVLSDEEPRAEVDVDLTTPGAYMGLNGKVTLAMTRTSPFASVAFGGLPLGRDLEITVAYGSNVDCTIVGTYGPRARVAPPLRPK